MAITIHLDPEKEALLHERAARRGKDADGYALDVLNSVLSEPELLVEEDQEAAELRARVKAARGMFSHISGGSYEFMRNKVYEKILEERHG